MKRKLGHQSPPPEPACGAARLFSSADTVATMKRMMAGLGTPTPSYRGIPLRRARSAPRPGRFLRLSPAPTPTTTCRPQPLSCRTALHPCPGTPMYAPARSGVNPPSTMALRGLVAAAEPLPATAGCSREDGACGADPLDP